MPNIPFFDATVDQLLGIQDELDFGKPPRYFSRTAAIRLSENGEPAGSRVADIVPALMAKIESRFDELGGPTPSKSNWKWQKHLQLSQNNCSAEKIAEKLIAGVMSDDWANQMPVWNGIENGIANSGRIDLVHRLNDTHYKMIELKFGTERNQGSNHPLYAIVEVLKYGLVYLLFRKRELLTEGTSVLHHVLGATDIGLTVLAPSRWYQYRIERSGEFRTFNFSWFVDGLNRSLQNCIDQILPENDLRMRIELCKLPENFVGRFINLTDELKHVRSVFTDLACYGPIQ